MLASLLWPVMALIFLASILPADNTVTVVALRVVFEVWDDFNLFGHPSQHVFKCVVTSLGRIVPNNMGFRVKFRAFAFWPLLGLRRFIVIQTEHNIYIYNKTFIRTRPESKHSACSVT